MVADILANVASNCVHSLANLHWPVSEVGLSIYLFESKMWDVGSSPEANIHGPALILLLDQQAVGWGFQVPEVEESWTVLWGEVNVH